VTRDGLAGLSEFALIMLDIATIDPIGLPITPPKATVNISASSNSAPCPRLVPQLFENRPDNDKITDKITESWDAGQYCHLKLKLILDDELAFQTANDANLTVVAIINGLLKVRIFNDAKLLVVDTDETKLRCQDRRIQELKNQLQCWLPAHVPNNEEKLEVIAAVISICGDPSIVRPIGTVFLSRPKAFQHTSLARPCVQVSTGSAPVGGSSVDSPRSAAPAR
jgi:hypothetical protein